MKCMMMTFKHFLWEVRKGEWLSKGEDMLLRLERATAVSWEPRQGGKLKKLRFTCKVFHFYGSSCHSIVLLKNSAAEYTSVLIWLKNLSFPVISLALYRYVVGACVLLRFFFSKNLTSLFTVRAQNQAHIAQYLLHEHGIDCLSNLARIFPMATENCGHRRENRLMEPLCKVAYNVTCLLQILFRSLERVMKILSMLYLRHSTSNKSL